MDLGIIAFISKIQSLVAQSSHSVETWVQSLAPPLDVIVRGCLGIIYSQGTDWFLQTANEIYGKVLSSGFIQLVRAFEPLLRQVITVG